MQKYFHDSLRKNRRGDVFGRFLVRGKIRYGSGRCWRPGSLRDVFGRILPKTRNPLFAQRASQEMSEEKLLLLLRDLLGRSFLFGFLNGHDVILLS
jgi:hypothetical protein